MSRLGKQFLEMMELVSSSSSFSQRLSDVTHTTLSEVRGPTLPISRASVLDWFVENAEKHPDRIAIVSQESSITYGELYTRSRALSYHLRTRCNCTVGSAVGVSTSWKQFTLQDIHASICGGDHKYYRGSDVRIIVPSSRSFLSTRSA